MKDLKGKVAVITGGASGIGRAMAERFSEAGVQLALVDIDSTSLEETAESIRKTGVEVFTRITDVSDGDAVSEVAASVVDHFGRVHIVCNNAGVATSGPIWELTPADWEFTFGPNLWGVIHGVRAFAPYLLEQDEGHFVNTASMAGLVSMANMGAYNVTKQGVVAYSETLFEDLRNASSQVGVSVLCPAFVQTRIWDSERNRPDHLKNEGADDRAAEQEPMRQVLRQIIENAMPADQVANAVYDAILENRLYILTHDATKPILEKRIGHILADENPTPIGADAGSLVS
jgi:NAD(P)-dependent dehydrogenase (short-subunit alcohol dehydrogenase family)